VSARDALYQLAVCGDDRTANQRIDAYRDEVLATAAAARDGAHRRIAEVLDYLATKDAVQLSEDAGAMGFHIVAILDGPGPIEAPTTRPALPWAAFLEDVEVSGLVEELASVFLDYWRGERAADASTLAEVERLLVKHRDGSPSAAAARKDTGGAPAGESTQPDADDLDDQVMSAVRRVIEDFDFAGYGIDGVDPTGLDAEWVGDLASAIAGALGGEPA
jgi:hypothetical protein